MNNDPIRDAYNEMVADRFTWSAEELQPAQDDVESLTPGAMPAEPDESTDPLRDLWQRVR
ncbi:hypothetical protein AB0F88_10980 [Streptosporangium sp. NPDC023963]|uniref:hypothetical protein n=1 Tax=Streptosporangium sp. NPDC023963 TaxID=3155608 RepID=UPI0034354BA1